MSKADKKGRHHLHIELTPAQYQLLTEQADACGLSKRAYLVRLMERMPLPVKPSQELKDLRWEVHKIGVNINQIARSVNAGIARAEDTRRGLFLLDQVYELMYRAAHHAQGQSWLRSLLGEVRNGSAASGHFDAVAGGTGV